MIKTEWLTPELKMQTTVLMIALTEMFFFYKFQHELLFLQILEKKTNLLAETFLRHEVFIKPKSMQLMSFIVHIVFDLFVWLSIPFVCLFQYLNKVYS